MDKNEIKIKLRDWMTATTQIFKMHNQFCGLGDISFWWRGQLGIKMNDKWVEKTLYGHKRKDHYDSSDGQGR